MTADQFKQLLDTISAVIAICVAIFGLPITYLQIRKTIAEIRKLELENEKERAKLKKSTKRIEIERSDEAIAGDPRMLGSLLLLIDFMIVGIVLILTNYALSIFLSGFFSGIKGIIMVSIAALLLIPIFREALRARKILRPKYTKQSNSQEERS